MRKKPEEDPVFVPAKACGNRHTVSTNMEICPRCGDELKPCVAKSTYFSEYWYEWLPDPDSFVRWRD